MCRLLGYVADSQTNFSQLLGNDYKEFVELSTMHCDGWGLAISDTGENTHVREAKTAVKSNLFAEASETLSSHGALLHLRWATPGLSVNESNTHPFTHKGISFIHNGAIKPVAALDQWIDPQYFNEIKGDTDSERYFYFLLTQIDRLGLADGIKYGIEKIRREIEYSSINCMVMSKDMYVVVSEHDLTKIPAQFDPDYYELRYKRTDHEVIVGSSGWNQSGWTQIPNHSLLVIDRSSLATRVIPLE